jgi:hypothetical protein
MRLDLNSDLTAAGDPRRLTSLAIQMEGAAWARDGRTVVFGSVANGFQYLWRVDAEDRLPPERLEVAGLRAPSRCLIAISSCSAGRGRTKIFIALGYSEPAAFTRAFKRWYDDTPQGSGSDNAAASPSPYEALRPNADFSHLINGFDSQELVRKPERLLQGGDSTGYRG